MIQCKAILLTAFADDECVKLLFVSGLHQNIADDGELFFIRREAALFAQNVGDSGERIAG